MAVESRMVALDSMAPEFNLPISNPWIDSSESETRSITNYEDAEILVVVFMCNHCPFAIHVEDILNRIAADYSGRGVQFVAINSNDAESYPADSFEKMSVRAREKGFVFPYLRDESQQVARAYDAVCTPDTFVFDNSRKLRYRGQVDETRPRRGEVAHGKDLADALDAILEGSEPAEVQLPSVGCSIKWKKA
ncbi:MAG: thioredoxin family protein [Rhodothermales bacterium]|nr:thioredoxin family protein [Rhodothermales bacterium]